jgi:Flp pilus assembly protein TadG
MRRVHKPAEKGAALVELAMVLPFLALLFLGTIDLGITIREHQILQNAAREGARFSALPRNWINPVVNPAASEAAIKQRVIDYLTQENITVAAGSITIDQQHPVTIGALTVWASQITVTYTRPLLVAGGPLLPFANVTLTGQSLFRNLY